MCVNIKQKSRSLITNEKNKGKYRMTQLIFFMHVLMKHTRVIIYMTSVLRVSFQFTSTRDVVAEAESG